MMLGLKGGKDISVGHVEDCWPRCRFALQLGAKWIRKDQGLKQTAVGVLRSERVITP